MVWNSVFKGFQIENWRDIKILSNSLNYNKLSKIYFWCFVISKFEKLLDLQLSKCFRKLFRKITNSTYLVAIWILSLGCVQRGGRKGGGGDLYNFAFLNQNSDGFKKKLRKDFISKFETACSFVTFNCKWEKNHQNTTKFKI